MAMITDIDDFFTKGCGRCDRFDTPDCSTRRFAKGLADLRRICRDMGLSEEVKWGHPCYMHAGRNVAIFGAFRGDYRLTFFHAALMKDPEGVLTKQGPNTQNAGVIRFEENDAVDRLEPVIRSYLKEAMGYADAGILPPREVREVELPDELVEVLDSDPELAEAFQSLTQGRQNSYAVNLNTAKTAATRYNRIARFRDKIIAGKGATER